MKHVLIKNSLNDQIDYIKENSFSHVNQHGKSIIFSFEGNSKELFNFGDNLNYNVTYLKISSFKAIKDLGNLDFQGVLILDLSSLKISKLKYNSFTYLYNKINSNFIEMEYRFYFLNLSIQTMSSDTLKFLFNTTIDYVLTFKRREEFMRFSAGRPYALCDHLDYSTHYNNSNELQLLDIPLSA